MPKFFKKQIIMIIHKILVIFTKSILRILKTLKYFHQISKS
jgi:hypothetical protein